jgi:acetyltransferase-like isoleucine patch superfamily enzyme
MRRVLKSFLVRLAKWIGPLIYERNYLVGKYFDESDVGWKWILKGIWNQKIRGINRNARFPVSPDVRVSNFRNLVLGRNNLNNFHSYGIYFQNLHAKIILGDGCYIAPNVGLITSNHDPENPDRHLEGKDIIIGDHSWIGMNAVVLPGVVLGPRTVVGAGSVVTKSFPEGKIVIAGNPARIIKRVDVTQ